MRESDFLAQLADIELPPAPSWAEFWLICTVIAAGLVILLGIAFFVRHRSKRLPLSYAIVAQEKLADLFEQWKARQLPERDIAYHLGTVLRLGLGLTQLCNECRPSMRIITEEEWLRVLQILNELRYKPHSGEQLTEEVFSTMKIWLQDRAERTT